MDSCRTFRANSCRKTGVSRAFLWMFIRPSGKRWVGTSISFSGLDRMNNLLTGNNVINRCGLFGVLRIESLSHPIPTRTAAVPRLLDHFTAISRFIRSVCCVLDGLRRAANEKSSKIVLYSRPINPTESLDYSCHRFRYHRNLGPFQVFYPPSLFVEIGRAVMSGCGFEAKAIVIIRAQTAQVQKNIFENVLVNTHPCAATWALELVSQRIVSVFL